MLDHVMSVMFVRSGFSTLGQVRSGYAWKGQVSSGQVKFFHVFRV
jgi:hypothetical protein